MDQDVAMAKLEPRIRPSIQAGDPKMPADEEAGEIQGFRAT